MKKLFYLFLLLPIAANAQKFGISLNGGYTLKTAKNEKILALRGYNPSQSTLGGTVRIFAKFRIVEIGAGVDVGGFQSTGKVISTKETYPDVYGKLKGAEVFSQGTITLPYVFANAHYKIIKPLSVYAGLMAGYMFSGQETYAFVEDPKAHSADPPYMLAQINKPLNIVTAGIQAGTIFSFKNHWSATAEFAMKGATFYSTSGGGLYRSVYTYYQNAVVGYQTETKSVKHIIFYNSISLGLRYTL